MCVRPFSLVGAIVFFAAGACSCLRLLVREPYRSFVCARPFSCWCVFARLVVVVRFLVLGVCSSV